MDETPSTELRELARSYGVHVDYTDMAGQLKAASTASLLAVLRALGAELAGPEGAPRALRERRLALARRRVEPVVVAWEEAPSFVEVRLPMALSSSRLSCQFWTEAGECLEWSIKAGMPARTSMMEVEGEAFLVVQLPLPEILPRGYYRLRVAYEDGEVSLVKVIAAPRRAYEEPAGADHRRWGVFCPLYALHRDSSWGAGDFADLEALIDWTSQLGGGIVATLPMLASHFDGPSPIISPYSPTSRLFWNEFYLDLSRNPELAGCKAARTLLESATVAEELERLKADDRVDYGRQMRLKRSVLEELSRAFFDGPNAQADAFYDFLKQNPDVADYAFFQAAGERHGRDWRSWPSGLDHYRDDSDVDADAYHYHLYVQWLADQQLRNLAAKTRQEGLAWYLDFPIGVDHNSFDVWKHREMFATGASVGCPPDPIFTKGQNWGFPPPHPDRQRESGYEYFIASLRNHMKYANALRIDHVMGLHRLFWIPQDGEAKDGAFVSTPAEEIYAILSLESHRHAAWLVGEDLGTVPPEVDRAMKTHHVKGMYVVQYEVRDDDARPLRQPPQVSVASVNTHDMPPFASYWGGLDLDDRFDLGLLDAERLENERLVRADQRKAVVKFLQAEGRLDPEVKTDEAGPILQAIWEWLAASPSEILLLNIEDLWLETESQNTPNTYLERPNWRRRLRRSLDEISRDSSTRETLERINSIRKQADGISGSA